MSDSAPLHRCLTCKSTLDNPRNLAVFIDGTSNKSGDRETNVLRLYNLVSDVEDPGLEQCIYYLEGIGAYDVDGLSWLSRARKWTYSRLEMAFAWNVERNVIEAYDWLASNYRKGSQIYLFGFSRGAYQVRALAAMIHEVGLVKEPRRKRIEQAYHRYLSVNPIDPQTREAAIHFKRTFCRPDVRVHFVGVWDTVSSLGLIKRDVHITTSASVTNACHFRHALALDERRVKFMPEYFREANAHRGSIQSPRSAISDVKEVWFAGFHSDIGGFSRPHTGADQNFVTNGHDSAQAGNIPFLWMRQKAIDKGLVITSEEIAWCPQDIDFGREDTMKSFLWKFLEVLPIRHQVSFNGAGKHKRRCHWSRPRLIIPDQQIHFSILSGDAYTPSAILGNLVEVPTVPRRASGELWSTDLLDEGATTRLLTSILSDQRKTLESLDRVLFLLGSRLDSRQTQPIHGLQWSEESVLQQSGFNKFALTVIYDITSNSSIPQELVKGARADLEAILRSPSHLCFPRALYILRFSAKHRSLRQRFIAHDGVVDALILVLDWIAESRDESLFPMVIDSLRFLVSDDNERSNVIDQLTARSDGAGTGPTRLASVLEVKAPTHLMASLRLTTSLAQYRPDVCEELKSRVIELAEKVGAPVGSAAVEALIALKVPLSHNVHFSNILGYLDNTLPRLDVEVGGAAVPNITGDLPPILRSNGSTEFDRGVMWELVSTIKSRNARQRTVATLTVLKLCNSPVIREFCSRYKVLDIFTEQLERKETSLLAAYALKTCLMPGVRTPNGFDLYRAAQLIIAMVDKGWFDGVVGRVEGSDIFRGLMMIGDLKQHVADLGLVATLKKLENDDRHETRMSLICLEVFLSESRLELERTVSHSLILLRDKDTKKQRRGIKTLSSLAQTKAGEQAIEPRLGEIVSMLLPPSDGSPPPRSRLFGPTAALYGLSKNETLRKQILRLHEFAAFKTLRHDNTLYPQTRRAI